MRRSGLICFFFNDTATTEIYTLSLHDALPISALALSLPSWVMFSAFLFGRRLALVPMHTDAPVEQRRPKPPSWTVVPALAVLVLTVLATVAVGDQTLSTAPIHAIGAWLLLFAAPVPAFVTWNFAARLYWLRTRG